MERVFLCGFTENKRVWASLTRHGGCNVHGSTEFIVSNFEASS